MLFNHKPLFFLLLFICGYSFAQNADQVINDFLEASGGQKNWEELSSTIMHAEVQNEGMSVPVSIYSTKEGKQAIVVDFMGDQITQFAYDGEVLWSTDSNMEPQTADEESTRNMKYSKNDFPSPFLNYKSKGYNADLLGIEVVDDRETYKILLVQEPIHIDGVEEEAMSYYYFDAETKFPVMVETEIKGGPMEGQFSTAKMNDYREVNGLFFPFQLEENGKQIEIKKIEVNPKIEESVFRFPK